MGFLNPLLLLGAFASLIPLLIHLWSRRQAKTVDFSSLMFLLAAHRKSVRRLQIRQWLILLLRMAIVALIAVAFARPLLKSQFSIAGARIHTSCVIVLDNSYSMQYEDVTGNRFEQAKKQALAIAETLQRGDRGSLILMSDRAEVVFPSLTTDLAQLAAAIREARVSERTTSIQAGLEAAYTLLDHSDDPNKEIYLITDLTQNAWRHWDRTIVRSGVRLFLVPVGEPNPPNISIEEIQTSNPLMAVDIPVRIDIQVRNYDMIPQETILSLVMDAQKQREIGLTLDPGTAYTQTLTYRFGTAGYHTGYVSVLQDRLSVDDRRYFALYVSGGIRLLSIGPSPSYLTLALQPEPPATPNQQYLLLPTVVSPEEIDETPLERYDIVTVNDLSELSPSDLLRLATYVQNGGKLLGFLGEGKSEMETLAPLMNIRLDPIRSFEPPLQLVLDEPASPLFAATPPRFFNGENAPQFYKARALKVKGRRQTANQGSSDASFSEPEPDVSSLAHFSGEETIPAILTNAEHSILLFNTSATDSAWSNFPLNATFVPLIQQSCLYLVGQPSLRTKRTVGQSHTIAVPDAEGVRARLRTQGAEDGENLVIDPDRTVETTAVEKAGIYQLDYTSDGTTRSYLFAVNVDTVESDLATYSAEQAVRLLGNAHLLEDTQQIREDLNHYRTGREIWGQLVLLSIALMMLELHLANRRRSSV